MYISKQHMNFKSEFNSRKENVLDDTIFELSNTCIHEYIK